MNVKQLGMSILLASAVSSVALADNNKYFKVEGNFGKTSSKVDGVNPEEYINEALNTEGTKSKKSNTGAGIAFGYKYDNNVRTEVSLSHAKLFSMKNEGESYSMNARATTLLVSAYYDFAGVINPSITPYVGAGVGLSTIRTKFSQKEVSESNRTNAFSYQVGTGVDVKLSNNISLDVGYRYINYGNRKMKDSDEKVKFNAHNVVAGLKYSF